METNMDNINTISTGVSRLIVKNMNDISYLGVPCIICNETVGIDKFEESRLHAGKTIIKVCLKCKQAILEMRSCIDKYEEMRK